MRHKMHHFQDRPSIPRPKRSVVTMKDLIPLQLSTSSSPSSSEGSSQFERSTFSSATPSFFQNEFCKLGELHQEYLSKKDENKIIAHQHPKALAGNMECMDEEDRASHHADSNWRKKVPSRRNYTRIPLRVQTQQYRSCYYEPVSPSLKNDFRLIKHNPHFQYSPATYDNTVDHFSSLGTAPNEVFDMRNLIESHLDEHCDHRTESAASNPPDMSRDSDLSFKCRGEFCCQIEAMADKEEEQLLKKSLNLQQQAEEFGWERGENVLDMNDMMSWQRIRSLSEEDEVDTIVKATTLAPTKAHMVKINKKRPIDLAINIPPRSSSLAGMPHLPITPDYNFRSWLEFDFSAPHEESLEECHRSIDALSMTMGSFRPGTPSRPSDLAAHSPPISPNTWHGQHDKGSTRHAIYGIPVNFTSNSYDARYKTSELGPLGHLVTVLEEEMFRFPNTTLTHDSSFIVQIRVAVVQAENQKCNLQSPPFSGSDNRQSVQTYRSLSIDTQAILNSFPVPTNVHMGPEITFMDSASSESIPPAGLRALSRVLPGTARHRSMLYTYIISYLFIEMLQSADDRKSFLHRSDHDSSIFSSKATRMGSAMYEPLASGPSHDVNKDGKLSRRLSRLSKNLERCITRFVQVIRNTSDEINCPDTASFNALVEMVRSTEAREESTY